MIIKKYWVVRATFIATEYKFYNESATRDEARTLVRGLKVPGQWRDIKMYRATEVETDNGFFNIYLEPAR